MPVAAPPHRPNRVSRWPGQSRAVPVAAMVRLSKPKTFQAYLDNCHRRYSCVHCRAHLANHDDLISKVTAGGKLAA
ncbi:hypothetical protein KIL84_006504 [Mauremys mutica]|uniref:Yippee domain-containing protein n=1 Tax=Mauremys mutica TaxID=74926 RepID=A0A9D3WZZ1_9SAUR|nr:hypothetical protein KIL84_006504 [Mauremys mutica]